jgi:nucleotidyltransferase substrate binding protein (TIGR01987 family)
MNKELDYSLEKLKKALSKLKAGVDEASNELQKDGVIQRFEFTFELLWKTLKIFLREKGIDTRTPKDSLKEAFRIGWINDEETFSQMLEDRNKMSHVYEETKAAEIFERIKSQYVHRLEAVFQNLKSIKL